MFAYIALGLDAVTGALLAAFHLYFREVTQWQSKQGLPFWRGWGLNRHHHSEWAWPSAPLLGAAFIIGG